MENRLVAVVAGEHMTTIVYEDTEGKSHSFVLDAVRHDRFIEDVYRWWIQADIDARKEKEWVK